MDWIAGVSLAHSMSKAGQASGRTIEPPLLRRAQAPRKPRRTMPTAVEIGQGTDPRVQLGRVVHHHRIALGLSQEDFADQVGLDRTYVSGIERGIRNPTLLVLLRMAQILEVPLGRLIEELGQG